VLLSGLLAQTVRAVVKLSSFLRSLGVTVSVHHCTAYNLCSGCYFFYLDYWLGPYAVEARGREGTVLEMSAQPLREISQSLAPT
jgi:hypothetical protein